MLQMIKDEGHGWLAVPYVQILDLDIQDRISSYSYKHEGIVYLEEDCDLHTYLSALFGRQDWYKCQARQSLLQCIPVTWYENAPCRNYPHYIKPGVAK